MVEKISDIMDPTDKRTMLVFGDAAAALVFGPATGREGLLGSVLKTDTSFGRSVTQPHARWTRVFEPVRFEHTNREMVEGAVALILEGVRGALDQAGLSIEDIEWVLPHQPNGRMFDGIVDSLGVDPVRTHRVVHEVGSTAGASTLISLDRVVRTRGAKPGDHVLMATIGGGVSYGALVLRLGELGARNRKQ